MSSKSKLWQPPGLIQNKVARNILLGLAIGVAVPIFLSSPYGLYFMVRGAARAYFRKLDLNRELRRLQKRGYVSLTKTPKGWLVRLLRKGKKRAEAAKFQTLKLPAGQNWDKKWRLFIFDIPEKNKVARDLLSRKLKNLGMYNIQRSVFVYPYDCRGELDLVASYYNLSIYTSYAEVEYFDLDLELRNFFKLRNS